jgi:tRNA(Arg) A34 adenosine deaminase TadA
VQQRVVIDVPEWVDELAALDEAYGEDARMGLAVALARGNVEHGSGGPFGAAVFEAATGRLVAVGVNCVLALGNSALHAELVALMAAERRGGSHSLREPAHELWTSCDPCAMCLGAIHWSGVGRVVCGAAREDAEAVGFDEGPVFDASYEYLRARGVLVERGVERDAARAVLELYRVREGVVY